MFLRQNAIGWVSGDKLTAPQINGIDVNLSRALDGNAGGTYAPSAQVVIGGAGLKTTVAEIAGTASITGVVTATGAITASDLTMSGTNRVKLASRSITRVVDCASWSFTAGEWVTGTNGMGVSDASVGPHQLMMPLHIPHGATLTKVGMLVDCPGHGGSWPPAVAPTFGVWRSSLADGAASAIVAAATTDSLAVQATYEAIRWFETGTLSEVIDRTTARYTARYTSEGSTNAQSGTKVLAVRVIYTIAAYDED